MVTEYTVCGNIPAIEQAAATDSSWDIYLVDNPGFGEAHSQEIMQVTESAMATSSAYIYIVAYGQIGDGKDRDCFKFIYNKDNGTYQLRCIVHIHCIYIHSVGWYITYM